ncbi:YodC family protein [Mesorhizobium opportunistum]|uniref:YodC family protein n=1 Tax=Mesorhizobium opportunistum TaxID=593909 RepID=UPI00333AAA85
MANAFKIGDTVQLKSGGPIMTVVNVGTSASNIESVWCQWFNDKGKPESGTFPVAAVLSAD